MNYVTNISMIFTTHNTEEVIVKSRGKFISKCVDVAEVACKRFMENKIEVKNIKINSEEFTNEHGKLIRVSSIEIFLGKKV